MSLPTTKPAQLSIRSFFHVQSPEPATRPPPPPPSAPPPAAVDHAPRHSPPNIPPQAAIRPIRPDDITPLRRLNALLLPVAYNDAFYQHAADPLSGRFSRLITWSGAPDSAPAIVGAIVCRLDPDPRSLYIQSLCLLSPYRAMGLAAAALDAVVAAAAADDDDNTPPLRAVTAHVWTENADGLHWYHARGFHRQGPAIPAYYVKLRPASAWLVSRPVGASSLLLLPRAGSAPPVPRHPIAGTTAAVINRPDDSRPPARPAGRSYQKQRPDEDWNDLPEDMAPALLPPARRSGSEATSAASSRSSSTARKKKDRSYPVAAFGGS